MIEFQLWDNTLKIDEDCAVYRIDKRSKKWKSVMNAKPDNRGYIRILLTNNEKKCRR